MVIKGWQAGTLDIQNVTDEWNVENNFVLIELRQAGGVYGDTMFYGMALRSPGFTGMPYFSRPAGQGYISKL